MFVCMCFWYACAYVFIICMRAYNYVRTYRGCCADRIHACIHTDSHMHACCHTIPCTSICLERPATSLAAHLVLHPPHHGSRLGTEPGTFWPVLSVRKAPKLVSFVTATLWQQRCRVWGLRVWWGPSPLMALAFEKLEPLLRLWRLLVDLR